MKTRPTAGDRRPEATAATSPTSSPQPTTYSIERLPPVEDPRRDPGVQTAAFAEAPGSVAAQDQPPQFAAGARAETVPATYQEEVPKPRGNPAAPSAPRLTDRLKIPPELPGANVPPLTLPPWNQPEKKMAVIELLFPDLHPMPPLAPPPPERRMSLAELEQMAVANSPIVAQAAADVTIALGTAIQVGVYPNPVIGYEADTVGSAGTRNYQGVFGTQVIKTANKLGLARSVANVDLMNAELALRKARVELLAQVKANYFAVLVAQENVMISDRLVRFTGVSYEIQDDKLIGGLASAYEAAQLRSLANQARTTLIQAQNSYVSAWKQLAATVGLPGLPMARLEETAEMPVPRLSFEAALERMLSVHTDMRAARNSVGQARLQLRLERVTPVPDVNVYGTFQRDFTTPLVPRTTYNVQVGVPVPLWDRNRGGILSADANVRRSMEQIRRVENDLTSQLSVAFGQFETNRINLEYFRGRILPDLVWAYNGVRERFQQEGERGGAVAFGDIIVAQQNLVAGYVTYVTLLSTQWSAVADLSRLLQVERLDELNLGNNVVPAEPQRFEPGPK